FFPVFFGVSINRYRFLPISPLENVTGNGRGRGTIMIKIAKLTDYAIVILGELAESAGDAASVRNVRDLAADTRLPMPTVSKVVKALARAGLLASRRGSK